MMSVFSRFYNKDVIIAEYEIDDYTGKAEKTVLSEIKADIQPYSGGRAREEYGLDIECQMRMFCDMSDDVNVGSKVEYDGDLSKWTEFSSGDEITATNGHKITVAEVTADGKARKSGSADVVSGE